jgi:Asp-tRNA(Asn)/Glu-tRNA(Gln) amidotransferase A subunit family amidase
MAKYVADAALMLGAMAGYDPADEFSAEIKDKKAEDYTMYLKKDGLKGKRLGLLVNNIGADPDVAAVVKKAVADIKALGAEIVEIDEPKLCASELLEANMLQRYAAKEDTDAYIAEVQPEFPFKDLQALVDDNKNGENMGEEAYKRFVKALTTGVSKSAPEYIAKIKENESLRDMAVGIMEGNRLDGFIYPLQSVLVVKTDDPRGQTERNGIIAAITGLPAVTVPAGYSAPTPTARQGVPVGLDFMARPFEEGKLIEMTYAYEQATKHRTPPEAFPDLDFSSVGA